MKTGVSRAILSMLLVSGGVGLVRAQSPSADFNILFPHFAAGGGFSTVFTFMNSGTTTANGILTLRDANGDGYPLTELSVPPQGVASYTVTRRGSATVYSGWAQYEGSGGDVTGVATFQLSDANNRLISITGVLSAPLVQSLRVPVETEPATSTHAAYAIANPGNTPITVSISAIDLNGFPLGEISRLTLMPRQQVARYLHQDMIVEDFFVGSLVMSTQDGPFIAVGLTEKQGLYSALPAISK